jgi:hypothetical protein
MNKGELLERVRLSRAEWEEAIAGLSDVQIEQPILPGGWSVKIVLAHLAWWERRLATIFATLRAGKPAQGPEFEKFEVDDVNNRVAAESRGRALTVVRGEEAAAFADLLVQIEDSSPQELFVVEHFSWNGGVSLATRVEWDTYGHYEEHLADIRKL